MRLLLCLVVLVSGCKSSSPESKVLSNAAFMKKFATPVDVPAPEPVTTNAPATQVTLPKLIAPGMVLTVMVAEDPSTWNKQYLIPPSGTVEILGVGRLTVTGLTTEELALKIKQPLERDYLQKATVTVTLESVPTAGPAGPVAAVSGPNIGGGVVYVLGNVGRPGPLMLPRDEVFTLTKVIIAAGGIGMFGNGAKVRVLRYDATGKKFETFVNVDRIMKRGEFEKDIPIQNGDWIIVPEKWINF
jgi:protein involved in polysaccharide export with SLBB domain